MDKDWILENGIGKGEGVRGAAIPPSTHTSPPVQVEFVTSDAILVSVYTVQALQFKDLPDDVSLNIVSRIFYFMYLLSPWTMRPLTMRPWTMCPNFGGLADVMSG